MEEKKVLFNKPENRKILNGFNNFLDSIPTDNEFEKIRNSHIKTIINSMAGNPNQWDEMCQFNIGWIGESFLSTLSNTSKNLTKEILDDIFSSCFRFLFELYLSIKNELNIEFESARTFAFKNLESFQFRAKEQIEYAIRDMPINIFKALVNSEEINNIKDFNEFARLSETKHKDWEQELAQAEQRVNTLKNALSEYESGFNFVGLFQGFDELSKDKVKEKGNLLIWLIVFGIFIVLPLISELAFIYLNFNNLDKFKNLLVFSIIPTASLLAILIYFFRIILYNYKSAKSHLLQIELRKTLCRFIQHYANYSSKVKEKDKDSLIKFENIIFSGIVTDDDKLPTTYDGVEQISNLIKSIRQ